MHYQFEKAGLRRRAGMLAGIASLLITIATIAFIVHLFLYKK